MIRCSGCGSSLCPCAMKVKLETIEKVFDFVEICKSFQDDVDISTGRYNVDAKSLLGVIAISTRPNLNVKLLTSNRLAVAEFADAIRQFEEE